MKEIELIEKRKPREKHFLQEDGTIIAKVYDSDIHYLKNGKYKEIDNSLVNNNGLIYNKSNDYKAEFKEDLKDSLMKISKDNYYIDFKIRSLNMDNFLSEKRKLSKKVNNITYSNITNDISIEYQTLSNKVKETIILKNNNYSQFTFELDTNLNIIKRNDEIIAQSPDGKTIFIIEKPYMIDFANVRCDNAYYLLDNFDDGYLLSLILDDEWLNSADRKFPVYVDPTITNNGQNINLYDTYIYPGDTNDVRWNRDYLKAGVEKVNGVTRPNRTLIKFSLPTIGTGSEIVYATLDLTPYPTNTEWPDYRLATMHRITSDWDETTANWSNMNDKYESRVESIFYGPRSRRYGDQVIPAFSSYDGNITNLVKKWYRNTPNYGIMIKSLDETTYIDDDFPAFYSKDNNLPNENNPKPIFSLVYRNQNGLEKYLDYREQNFTDGCAYANTYNGNLTTIFHLAHTVGGNLPVNLELVYNTNDVVLNNKTFFTKGYRLNLEQTIKDVTIDNDSYLEYLDEDGTLHYFKKKEKSDSYVDEDGLNLTIDKTDSSYTMKDINGNSMVFTKVGDTYRLTSITDIDNNSINITLNDNNSISEIIDKYGNKVEITYNDSNTIFISPDMTTTINYSNNLLTSIETINGTTSFEYNSNDIISSITDCNGLKVEYEYYINKPYRLLTITQFGLNGMKGESFTLNYEFDSTSIIDNKGKTTTLIYNSYGNLLSQNNLGSKEDVENAYSINQTYGSEDNNKNRILSSEIPIRYIRNYLKNASFENDNNYFVVDSDSSMISSSICATECHTGVNSLQVVSQADNQSIQQTISVPKGNYYTFSGYFKNTDYIEIILSYLDKDGKIVTSTQKIEPSNEFIRNDVTIYYENLATSELKITIKLLSKAVVYIDDVQLEVGEVANSFNIIENSDFSEGYSEWELDAWSYDDSSISPNDSFSVVKFNNNKNTALKVSTNPNYGVRFTKVIPVKGKKGDLYTCSFWYKNLGIPGYGRVAGSTVSIYFKPIGQDADYCILTSEPFNPNENQWQFFTYRSHAPEDFECIKLTFLIGREANDFYLTNLSLYNNTTSGEYEYDENGNLVSIKDQNGNTNVFNYDENNQLIKATNVLGKDFKYEYDNNKTDRVLSTISSSGISNRVIYDKNGNPIITKISKKYKTDINDGVYKIRNKGTYKYLKAELNTVLLEENDCSNTIWKLEKSGDFYKIIYDINPEYSISVRNDKVVLDKEDTNNLFIIEKNTDNFNGTYHIKYSDKADIPEAYWLKYLIVDGDVLSVKPYTEIDDKALYNIEFYLELKEELFIENNATYTDDNRFIKKIVDSAFNEKVYNPDMTTGLLESVVSQSNKKIEYIHNNKRQVTQIKNNTREINYEYNMNNMVSKISQNNKTFNLSYDNFLNLKSVNLNDNLELLNNEYGINYNLLKTTYGNGDKISYEYDDFDRVSKFIKMDNIGLYRYDNNGHLAKLNSDYNNYKYYYDMGNRLYKFIDNELTIDISYDDDNFITKKAYKLVKDKNSCNHVLNINYVDELPNSVNIDDNIINYTYDNLDRVTSKSVNNLYNIQYKYKSNGNRTTDFIEEYCIDNNNYKYIYDHDGNLTFVYYNSNLINSYEYDEYNELIKETDYKLNQYIEYGYDNSGNMISNVTKNLDTNELLASHNYLYNNLLWEDQLTCYDTEEIKYDKIGNVSKIGNADLFWINGKELNKYVDNISNKTIDYKYNIDGIRISKTVNGIETKYYMDENNIIFEENPNNIIYYLYDLDGVIGLNHNGNIYYYIKNYHNDIIGIIDNNGNLIVSYTYDSWGNVLSIKDNDGNEITDNDNIGIINPFRYRSYYYDKETDLYYLNSRYYNPKWGRFISPDTLIGANQDIFSNNLYLYVSNNPINNIDGLGNSLLGSLLKGILGKLQKQPKKSKKKSTAKKAKKANKSSSKVIPNVSTSTSYSAGGSVAKGNAGSYLFDFSNSSGTTSSYSIYDSDSPFDIDIYIDPNIFDSNVSFQISTPIGNISKSYGILSDSIRLETKFKRNGNSVRRNVWESGTSMFSFYAQTGHDTYINRGAYSYSYDKMTISKLVVAIAVAAPQLLKLMGKYPFVKSSLPALARAFS